MLLDKNAYAVKRKPDAVFIPQRETELNGQIVASCSRHIKLIDGFSVITERNHSVRDGDNAGIGIRLCISVNNDTVKVCFLRFSVGGEIPPSFIDFTHQGVAVMFSIPSFHVVIDMRKGKGTLIVIIPVGNDGNLRRCGCRFLKLIVARHPVLCSVIGMRYAPVGVA